MSSTAQSRACHGPILRRTCWRISISTSRVRQRGGERSDSEIGAILSRSQFQSRTALDTRFSRTKEGVHYLQIDCGGRRCNPDQALFQDVPIDRVKDGERVDYGFSGVVEGSEGGIMRVELSQRDSAGRDLWSTSFDANVPTEASGVKPEESIYRASSVFLTTSPPLRIAPAPFPFACR